MSDETEARARLTALAPRAIETGAVISFSGDTLVASGEDIVDAVDRRLTSPAASVHQGDQWLTDAVPVLARGAAWIVPLAWVPSEPDRDEVGSRTLRDRIHDLWAAIQSACSFRQGDQIAIDLTGDRGAVTPYASELARTGARRADWWEFGSAAVVLVVYGDAVPAPVSRMAVHVVPVGWVSDRRPTPPRKIPTLDLEWSWEDVVAFARTEIADAADSLADQERGRDS